MYEKLKKEMKEILEVVKQCPEKFQGKCFELLLANFLEKEKEIPIPEKDKERKPGVPPFKEKIKKEDIHMKVKAFFQKFNLPLDQLGKLFLMEKGHIEPTYKLDTTVIAHAQIQLSLLEALKEAVNSGNFKFEMEDIRSLCKDKKCYDSANFLAHFKKNKDLFKNKTFNKDEPIELSDEGMKELAEIIKDLTIEAKE